MLHDECKPRYLESQDASSTEPSSKRMKSREEPYGKSYEGLQNFHEEVHIKKTHSGFIPLSLSDDGNDNNTNNGEELQQRGKTTEHLDPCNRTFPYKKTMSPTKVTGNRCSSYTNSYYNRENKNVVRKHKNEGETEIYSTSKAFIGPLFKNEPVQTCNRKKKAETALKQTLSSDAPKIDDELSQFYNELKQLEDDENQLGDNIRGTENDFNGQFVEYNDLNQTIDANSQEWSHRTSLDGSTTGQFFYKDVDHRKGRELYHCRSQAGDESDNGQLCNIENSIWEDEQLCNKQESSRFWNDSVPQFRPSWQHSHAFIIPYGPPPPHYTSHFNFQEPHSLTLRSDNLNPSNVGLFKNIHVNMSSSASDQNSDYTNHFGFHSVQTPGNGCNSPNGHIGNGFCEPRACWKDIKMYHNERSSNVSQQFLEDRLCEAQKLLLILRGLPGSGKTTLSRFLLGQNPDGIVFSTDDYFRQNNGCWSYNVGQLGTAHDWNQKRAKQAMDQGKSPIIIDNTNTQAWEMKPYVETALEKGYQVEFREPDTWWKFDPEELERRNEHGVSREKIVQMLERYEYKISIPIVMNSVLPFHKTSQWPPPQRRQRECITKKKHILHKMKKRRKRKRNKKVKGAAIKVVKKKSGGPLSPTDDDSSHSTQEDSEDSEKPEFVTGHLNEPNDAVNSFPYNILKCSHLQNGNLIVSDQLDLLTLGNSEKVDVVSGDSSLMHLPSGLKDSLGEQSSIDNLPRKIHGMSFVEDGGTILAYDNQSSLKVDHSGTITMEAKDEDKPAGVVLESGMKNECFSLIRKKNITVPHQHRPSKKNERNTWAFFTFDMAEKKTHVKISDSCLPWPEGTSQVVCEQRPKKWRRPKQVACSEITVVVNSQMDKETVKRDHREVRNENNTMTDCAVLSSLTMNIHKMPCIEMSDFPRESRGIFGIPNDVSKLISPRKTGKCKRIFKLAPNFDLPRQIPITKVERMLKAIDVSVEQVNISDERTREKDKTNEYQESSVVVKLPPNVDVEPILCNAEESINSSRLAVHLIQTCTGPPKTSLSSEQLIVTFDQIVEANMEENGESLSPDTSATQPDILCSVKETTDSADGKTVEIKQMNETKETTYSQIKHEDTLHTKPNSLGFPLSPGFALQLVALFGSPGVPLDTLLPDDYIVPLDWTISKEIYLQWKTSVEKKQRNSISKENSLLPADAINPEDSNKNGQERQESPDMNPQMYLQEPPLL